MNPLKKRSNFATASIQDAKVTTKFKSTNGFINTGVDINNAEHHSDISDPDNGMFFINNVNRV